MSKKEHKSSLGDFSPSSASFPNVEKYLGELKAKQFLELPEKGRFEKVNKLLFSLIEEAKPPCFLLPHVVDFIERVNSAKIVDRYTMTTFELFLNHFSKISAEENYRIRGKIVGKYIPRECYQIIFPVGMGKVFQGSHFVTAHSSPDLDTTVASFWGWVDAFGCKVSEGLHFWNVPGGPPEAQVEIGLLFEKIFGKSIFTAVAKTKSALTVSGLDLLTQKGMHRKLVSDHHDGPSKEESTFVLVDGEGYFVGEWRSFDLEGVRHLTFLLSNCLRWFENHLHVKLLGFFAKDTPKASDVPSFLKDLLQTRIVDCPAAKGFSEQEKKHLKAFLIRVLKVPHGLESTFGDFARSIKVDSQHLFKDFLHHVESLNASALFEKSGVLVENRPGIFDYLQKTIVGLDLAILAVREFVERLDVSLQIKTEIFGYHPRYASSRADIDEIRSKMGSYPYLTITASDRSGNLFPMGVVSANDIHKPILGTVTLRDFCNREETKIPSYLEVISVVDHHKSSLQTSSPPVAFISDAQSSNGMVAELSFQLNDPFSSSGIDKEEVSKQLDKALRHLTDFKQKRIVQRLLQKQIAHEKKGEWFVSAEREYVEYLHFLYAILDDTDLLTKVSSRDVITVASLLNRLKTLATKEETEIVSFDDLEGDPQFVKKAARRLLQNEDLYALYRKVYQAKEEAVDSNILLCAQNKPCTFFADTKEQNGCCRVGQAKMFAKNFPVFEKHASAIRRLWLDQSMAVNKEQKDYDFHLQMISTLAGAEDLYEGVVDDFRHKDELWIWIPQTDLGIQHLKGFLNSFKALPVLQQKETEVEFLGDNAQELDLIFTESFLSIARKKTEAKEKLPIAVLRYKAGAINSRKAQVSPFLPKLI